jgi:hypothetical protein
MNQPHAVVFILVVAALTLLKAVINFVSLCEGRYPRTPKIPSGVDATLLIFRMATVAYAAFILYGARP